MKLLPEVKAYIDAGAMFDIAANEGRLLHFNGGQAHIRMWKNRNTVLSIDFAAGKGPQLSVWISEQYIKDNEHNCADYQERYKTQSMEEWIYSFFKDQEQ